MNVGNFDCFLGLKWPSLPAGMGRECDNGDLRCVTKANDLPKSTERSGGRWGHRVYATLAASITEPFRIVRCWRLVPNLFYSVQFVPPTRLFH